MLPKLLIQLNIKPAQFLANSLWACLAHLKASSWTCRPWNRGTGHQPWLGSSAEPATGSQGTDHPSTRQLPGVALEEVGSTYSSASAAEPLPQPHTEESTNKQPTEAQCAVFLRKIYLTSFTWRNTPKRKSQYNEKFKSRPQNFKHQDQNPKVLVLRLKFLVNLEKLKTYVPYRLLNETRINKHAKCFTFYCRHSS